MATTTDRAGRVRWLRHLRTRFFSLFMIAAMLTAFGVSPAAAQPGDPGYVLGMNDGLSVKVYGQSEFDVQTRVKPDGSIVLPLIGKIQAAGKTVLTLADDITRKLEGGNYLRDPVVNVEITQYNSKYVRVIGKVGSPQMVPLDRPYDLLDVLLRAGWVRADGSRYVLLRHASDNKQTRIDTDELARSGSAAPVLVQPGDTIFVEPAEVVYLTGQVQRPGAYQLEPNMTVAKLIAMAGGVGPTGSSSKFGLRRGSGKEQSVDDQFVLQKDDVVNVKERLF